MAVFHDITQEKLVERLKDEFLSIVSHELRTPLTAIMGYSDLMLRGVHGALTDRQGKAIRSVRANAVRLLHLINDLLDVSRLEVGLRDAQPRVAGHRGDDFACDYAHPGYRIGSGGGPHQPRAAAPPRSGSADETKVQQVIENLLTNAVKFTPEGQRNVRRRAFGVLRRRRGREDPASRVAIATGTNAGSVIVTVADTGTGLEEDQLERIWDRDSTR